MDQSPDLARALYCGDNLPVLRSHLADESVDLIYLDPPFYSQRNYQAFLRKPPSPLRDHARAPAFGDVWRWEPEVEQSYTEIVRQAPRAVGRALRTLRDLLGPGPLLAYLIMMAERLIELRRVLKSTGSVYLHCDPAASHYLKLLLDAVFGAANFRNEIVWSYKTGGASPRHFARKHDLIFFYSKSDRYIFHALKEKSYMMHRYGFKKSEFLRDERGAYTWVYMKDVWELPALGAADGQRLGYPTQKPEALLERIIQVSSDEGSVVLDPFCGSGTTLAVAQRLGRGWMGVESHYLGVAYQRYRLSRAFPELRYTFTGGPASVEEARRLARADTAQLRWWALSLVCARPVGVEDQEQLKQGNGSVHGILPGSSDERRHQPVVVVIDELDREQARRLRGLALADGHAGLLLITLEAPAREVLASLAGTSSPIKVCTIAELLKEERKFISLEQ